LTLSNYAVDDRRGQSIVSVPLIGFADPWGRAIIDQAEAAWTAKS
jgi:hypothetical protein